MIYKLNNALPFFTNYSTHKETVENQPYTATEDCAVYIEIVTNETLYGIITTTINGRYFDQRYNQVAASIAHGFTLYLKKNDVLSVEGIGLKSYKIFSYV